MKLAFCKHPFERGQPDFGFEDQYAAAREAGFDTLLFDFDTLVLPAGEGPLLYRGWMMSASRYEEFLASCKRAGYQPVTDLNSYLATHHLPRSYPLLAPHTPRSVWLECDGLPDETQLAQVLAPLRGPVVLKDFVKSVKHYWEEACFIPDCADLEGVVRVVKAFLEHRGEALEGGLVFREFVELESLGPHPKSGMPMAREFRRFYWKGRVLTTFPYWEDQEAVGLPDQELYQELIARVPSEFLVADFARTAAGEWIVIELGDGQVSGLPDEASAVDFYRALADQLSSSTR